MAFLVFTRTRVDASFRLRLKPTDPARPLIVLGQNGRLQYGECEQFMLGGHHLIYKAWQGLGCPTDEGWHVSADELIKLHTQAAESYATRRLIIDFDPGARHRIGLVELLDIYAYTYGTGPSHQPSWTPLMLRLRDVLYCEPGQGAPEISPEKKAHIVSDISEPTDDKDFLSFLYLNGDATRLPRLRWNWGKSGTTSAAFIQSGAREYFRQVF